MPRRGLVLEIDIVNRISMACISGIEVKGKDRGRRINCGGGKWKDYAADPGEANVPFSGGVRIRVWPRAAPGS